VDEVCWTQARPRLRLVVTRAATGTTRPPVLLLHGLWHASWAWENWCHWLAARGYDCYAVDLRGHGGSEGAVRTARLRDHLQDARRAVAVLPEPPILIGHSLGGVLVEHLLAAGTYPAAVLVASVPGRYPLGTIVESAVTRPVKTLEAALRHDLFTLVCTARGARRVLFSPDTPADIVRQTQRRLTRASPRIVRELLLTAPARPRPTTPVLVLAGARDPVFTPTRQRRRARTIGADYVEIDGSGHDVPLDHRWRQAADSTAAWLDDQVS
jgi:pimeloyl-ACP methyl ester carboxylesterase